jgi:hypothetical protein
VANGRKRNNYVNSLKNGELVIEGTKNLLDQASSFYKELFGPSPGNLVPIGDDLWSPEEKLNEDDNVDLSRPFSVDEIKNAIFPWMLIKPQVWTISLLNFFNIAGILFNLISLICLRIL